MASHRAGAARFVPTRFIAVTSPAAPTVAENSAFSQVLTADVPVTWTLQGGADRARFALSGSTLSMTAKDFEVPLDANGDNVYEVVVQATDERGFTKLHPMSVRVTDVPAA